jgi:DNA-binding NarL/FixJ family response regulator
MAAASVLFHTICVKRKTRILIVDDHALVRRALKLFIENDASYKVCAEAETTEQTIDAIRKAHPDLVLLDLFLREEDGLDIARLIRERYAKLPIIVLTMHRTEIFGDRARRAGANGYVMKDEATERLLPIMQSVMARRQHPSRRIGPAPRPQRRARAR